MRECYLAAELYHISIIISCNLVLSRVNSVYIEESILLPNTPVEERSVKL